jgi:hypothetical protein
MKPQRGAGIRIQFRLRSVLWTDWPERDWRDYHGFKLKRHDIASKRRIATMLRAMPKKWDKRKGRTYHIFALPDVTSSWY